ncbi:MAG: hypothetical protein EPO06_06275 [Burkholderiaceae bacterium]|nr:MAG: hypothetical protein EPO06_06275 [Burkholderiaceae bacterium]
MENNKETYNEKQFLAALIETLTESASSRKIKQIVRLCLLGIFIPLLAYFYLYTDFFHAKPGAALALGWLLALIVYSGISSLSIKYLTPYADIEGMKERYVALTGKAIDSASSTKRFCKRLLLGLLLGALLITIFENIPAGRKLGSWSSGDGKCTSGGCSCTVDRSGNKGTLEWRWDGGHGYYEGELKSCQRQGRGVTQTYLDTGKSWRCEGEYSANMMNGQATCEIREADGVAWERYTGNHVNDLRDGEGLLEGQTESGRLKNCKGQFKRGDLNGKAVCEWRRDPEKKWSRCQGIFRDEKMEGPGECEWHEDGKNTWNRYRGNFKNNLFDGKGTFDWYENKQEWWARYTGEHKEGDREGSGVYEWKNGTYFTGRVEQGDSKNGWSVAYHDPKSNKWCVGRDCETQPQFAGLQFAIIHRVGAESSDVGIFPCGGDATECRKKLVQMRHDNTNHNAPISKNDGSLDQADQGLSKENSKD